MIPWPIALLSLFYAAVAASSTSTLWRVAVGQLHRSVVWPAIWFTASAALVMGLAFLKPWARTLAVWSSTVMVATSLGAAGLAIVRAHPEPWQSLCATGIAGAHLMVIRYLTRPHVRVWFGASELVKE